MIKYIGAPPSLYNCSLYNSLLVHSLHKIYTTKFLSTMLTCHEITLVKILQSMKSYEKLLNALNARKRTSYVGNCLL